MMRKDDGIRSPRNHGDDMNFGFADGHSEYWKWFDYRNIKVAEMDFDYWQVTGQHGAFSIQPGNQDL